MDEQPLLSDGGFHLSNSYKETPVLVSFLKWVLKFVMWVVFLLWVSVIFLFPLEIISKIFSPNFEALTSLPFGIKGNFFLAFAGPILVLTFLSTAYLIISGEAVYNKKKGSKYPTLRLWTLPVLVDGPFGVVSAAEFIGILFFVVFIIWGAYAYTMSNLQLAPIFHANTKYEFSLLMLELSGVRLGMLGQLCLAFLFLPISRGSVLLRLVDIPFEHATRYHIWLGHLTMVLFTLHGLCYVIVWTLKGRLIELLDWRNIGIAILPGVIALLAGLLMWFTSLHPVRKNYFELFFYTHQLYIVFVVGLALHVGDYIFSVVAGGIFLFILDRFLRFCQSRRTVDVLSAKCLPCGTVELVLSKPGNLRYNALSFIFLQIRELSWLQWHPFSVSSSPLDGKYHLSILIKVLGGWTAKLRDNILSMSETEQQVDFRFQSHPKITASVEGPYGHEMPYHLMYENLILVAGGIGISPFLAILSDILHRISEGKPCLPRKVLIVWAIKRSDELPLLSTVDMESICPSFPEKLNLEIDIYVTRESEPQLEEGVVGKQMTTSICPVTKGCDMSVLVGTGDNIWSGLYVISSTAGLFILSGLLDMLYLKPYSITSWWYRGLLFTGCMVVSVLVFGGVVIGLWHLLGQRIPHDQDEKMKVHEAHNNETDGANKDSLQKTLTHLSEIHYGSRPDFKEIFGGIHGKWGGVDVGVIVCGPPPLQSSVAQEIRSHSRRRSLHHPIFHFNSHSFDL